MNKFLYILFFLSTSLMCMFEIEDSNGNNLMTLAFAALGNEEQTTNKLDLEKKEIGEIMIHHRGDAAIYARICSIIDNSPHKKVLLNELTWDEDNIPFPHFIFRCNMPALYGYILAIYPQFDLNRPDFYGSNLYCMYNHSSTREKINKDRHYKYVKKNGFCVNNLCKKCPRKQPLEQENADGLSAVKILSSFHESKRQKLTPQVTQAV